MEYSPKDVGKSKALASKSYERELMTEKLI